MNFFIFSRDSLTLTSRCNIWEISVRYCFNDLKKEEKKIQKTALLDYTVGTDN